MKICVLPERVDMNARCRPLGDQAGLSLRAFAEGQLADLAGGQVDHLDVESRARSRANAISLYGAGDQVGRSAYDSEVIFCRPRPSAPTM